MNKVCSYLVSLILFTACESSTNTGTTLQNTFETDYHDLHYTVTFPEDLGPVVERDVSNPIFPNSPITTWTVEGIDSMNHYQFFLTVNEFSDSLMYEIVTLDNGLDYLMESTLKGGVERYDGINPRIIDIDKQNLRGKEVNAHFKSELFRDGIVTIQLFSDWQYMIGAGVVSGDPEDENIKRFFESFEVEVRNVKE